ncbi:hypothetical protein [Taibaiella koreensis]|uniref:hypothetical protein n=1 Tax=Taibaiella koreensis TaxID=1268548 RepID=UPI000E59DF55|nr:hypothetical protein [Taibaiella koreensis]
MKIPAALLHTLSLALLASACQSSPAGKQPEAQVGQIVRDSVTRLPAPVDTPQLSNGLRQQILPGEGDNCPPCGRG